MLFERRKNTVYLLAIIASLGAGLLLSSSILQTAYAEDEHDKHHDVDDKWEQLEREFHERMSELDEEEHKHIMEIEHHYDEKRIALEKEYEGNHDGHEFHLKLEELDRAFEEEFASFLRVHDEKRMALEREFEEEFEALEKEHGDYYSDYDYEYDYDDYRHDDYDYDHDIEYDEEIESLKDRVMQAFSMDEIDSFMINDDMEGLISAIVHRTDLTREDVMRIIEYEEKRGYMDEYYDDYEHERDYEDDDYYRDSFVDVPDSAFTRHDGNDDALSEVISENEMLREENRELQTEIFVLKDKITDLEQQLESLQAVVMEQIQIIYEWVVSK